MEESGKKGIGIIGYGGFGAFIHKAWNEMDNAHVTAVCDSDTSRDPGNATFYTDFNEMLKDETVDIVSIATPPSSHKELSIQAMKAGKHVLIEKPLALSEKDCLEIQSVAKSTSRVATVNFVLRHNDVVSALRDIIQSEVFGKLRRVDLRNYAMQETVPEGHWFWDTEISGRILLEHGVHFFDLASYVMNTKANTAWSTAVERKPGMEDEVFAVIGYDNNVIGTYWHSFSRPRELETTVFHFAFDLAEINMVGWIPLELNIWGWTDKKGKDTLIKYCPESGLKKVSHRVEKSSEFDYKIDYEIDTNFRMTRPKMHVYSDSIRSVMDDLIRAIDNPGYKMLVTLEDAMEAVCTAEKATLVAHPCTE